MGRAAGFIAEQRNSGRAGVGIAIVELRIVEWRKVIRDCEASAGREPEVAFTKIGSGGGIEIRGAVGSHGIYVAVRVGGGRGAAAPKGSGIAVGSIVVDAHLLERVSVIADDPTVVQAQVTVRGPQSIDHAIEQQKSGALFIGLRLEYVRGSAIARAGHGGLNRHWAAGLFRAGSHIERVQAMYILACFLSHGNQVNRPGLRIDDGRAGDADFRRNLAAASVSCWNGGGSGV